MGRSIGPVTNVMENLRMELPLDRLSPLNMNQSKVFVIGSQDESVEGNRNIICTSRDSRNIRVYHSRIGNLVVNKDVSNP